MTTVTPAAAAAPLSPAKVAGPVLQLLALDQIHPDPNQPRKAFTTEAITELANSIRGDGLQQPILVRPNGKGFLIVDGERRYRALKQIGEKSAQVLIRADLKDQDVTSAQLVANLQREDLTLAEQCDAVTKLVRSLNGPDGRGGVMKAATKLGKSEAWVSKRAAVAVMPAPIQKLVQDGKLVDVELAAGLTELHDVDAKMAQELIEQVRKPGPYDQPLTRDDLRDEVKSAKAAKKHRAEAAAAAAKTRAKNGGKNSQAEAARKAKEQKDRRLAQWRDFKPVAQKFVEAASAALRALFTGTVGRLNVSAPSVFEYNPDPCPAGIDVAKFNVSFPKASADQWQGFISRSGLTIKLDLDLEELTPQEAKKIEQALGRKLAFESHGWNFEATGKQIQHAVTKGGQKLELPAIPAAEKKVEAPAKKPAAAKAKRK